MYENFGQYGSGPPPPSSYGGGPTIVMNSSQHVQQRLDDLEREMSRMSRSGSDGSLVKVHGGRPLTPGTRLPPLGYDQMQGSGQPIVVQMPAGAAGSNDSVSRR